MSKKTKLSTEGAELNTSKRICKIATQGVAIWSLDDE